MAAAPLRPVAVVVVVVVPVAAVVSLPQHLAQAGLRALHRAGDELEVLVEEFDEFLWRRFLRK